MVFMQLIESKTSLTLIIIFSATNNCLVISQQVRFIHKASEAMWTRFVKCIMMS
jgi:hypothetical protein